MTTIHAFDPPPVPTEGRAAGRSSLVTGLTVLLLLVVAGGWFVATRVFSRADLNVTATAPTDGATSVRISGGNADITVEPSPDAAVHVHATGSYTGPAPDIEARTADGVTTVKVLCHNNWLEWCDITATVQMPALMSLTLTTDNGDADVGGVDGDLDLSSDNGGLTIDGGTANITAVTDNGAISIENSLATSVKVKTSNGSIDAELLSAPTLLQAETDNGDVDLAVSSKAKYDVDTNTDNGTEEIQVGVDTDSANHIIATTDNGDIRIHTSS